MTATAHARYVRLSPRKLDQILMLVRGKTVAHALDVLRVVTKRSRPVIEKLIKSAFANAGKNQPALEWKIDQAWSVQGPVLKRMRAHAMGRGATIRHRSAHVTVVLKHQPSVVKKVAAPAPAKASKKQQGA